MAALPDPAHRGPTPSNTLSLEERFDVLKEIGDGSFGRVVLARVRSAGASVARRGTVVAIKSMKKTFESFSSCIELREVVFLRTLPPHAHLVPALDIFLDPYTKKLHICMEYMEGNLYQLMKARDHKCLDNASVKSILYQIMLGLEHIHAHNFFHRDIKPENILVSTSGHSDTSISLRRYSALTTSPLTPHAYSVKIADFGLARETHSRLPYTTYVSTRWYRAPEVLLRAGEYSAPVDIWAIGAMAVEVATLKPLFPGGNEVDQVWRVCEIMGSPGNWCNRSGVRVGGGDWKEGTRLATKLGFSFPKMAPHSMDAILPAPQWPVTLSHFVSWCLMWDPKNRPTSSQALSHEYFTDAVDPLRPKSSTSRLLGRKQSDVGRPRESPPHIQLTSKPSWFRKSLIGRTEAAEIGVPPAASTESVSSSTTRRPQPAPQPQPHASPAAKQRTSVSKRTTWNNGPSNIAPMPILPTIRPISPFSDTVTAEAQNNPSPASHAQVHVSGRNAPGPQASSKKLGRQLSVTSSTNNYAEIHRQQAERALNGNAGLASPPSAQKEGFFSHLRKRARRFSARHQTPISPTYQDMEAQAGCGPWASNRSSLAVDRSAGAPLAPAPKENPYETPERPPRDAYFNDAPSVQSIHQTPSANNLKRHHSLPRHQQPRSMDNLQSPAHGAAGPISSRTRRGQALQTVTQYDAPDEQDELLDEALTSAHHAMKRLEQDSDNKPLRKAASNIVFPNPYPTPSPSANGNAVLFGDGHEALTPHPLNLSKNSSEHKWPTPPYEESDWAASASASIWAACNRF